GGTMKRTSMRRLCRTFPIVFIAALTAAPALAQPQYGAADALLAIDQNRASVVERVVTNWGPAFARSPAAVRVDELRQSLLTLRADRLLAASLAGTMDGVRNAVGLDESAPPSVDRKPAAQEKAVGETGRDVVYTPVTPCRLVDTRGAFASVYQGDGSASHTPSPFLSNQIRTYTLEGANGVCLTQLPPTLTPGAVQLQVFAMPTTSASGDVEILPQGGTFGSTATMVYVGTIAFNTVSTAAKVNVDNKQISVQVRGGGAHIAIDVVGYFSRPANYAGTHTITGAQAVDGGGSSNAATGDWSVVAGGQGNTAAGRWSVIAGGSANATTNDYQAIGGGASNTAHGFISVIGGGALNDVNGNYGTIGGGHLNKTTFMESPVVSGGEANTASGNFSTVPGGRSNTASGAYSFAAGHRAKATTQCSFIWADSQEFDFQPSVGNFFGVRATGGVGLTVAINPTTGAVSQYCNLLPGTPSWTCVSDRNAKENFAAVDAADILRKLVAMPISTWNFKGGDPRIRSLGPTAQDFYAAFALGNDDKTIATSNLASVGLAAIQGLHTLVQQQAAELAALRAELKAMRAGLADLPRASVDERVAGD
ncbi:MAG TPA: tail fiber domain-containing protein, partial [Casimicrobiaceae bacterium]